MATIIIINAEFSVNNRFIVYSSHVSPLWITDFHLPLIGVYALTFVKEGGKWK
jgi:hypothetical protein